MVMSGGFSSREERDYYRGLEKYANAINKANKARGLITARSQRNAIRKSGGWDSFNAREAAARGY